MNQPIDNPVTIHCPNCGQHTQATATLNEGDPFWTYLHTCDCGYTIMESEWDEVNETPKNKGGD